MTPSPRVPRAVVVADQSLDQERLQVARSRSYRWHAGERSPDPNLSSVGPDGRFVDVMDMSVTQNISSEVSKGS